MTVGARLPPQSTLPPTPDEDEMFVSDCVGSATKGGCCAASLEPGCTGCCALDPMVVLQTSGPTGAVVQLQVMIGLLLLKKIL